MIRVILAEDHPVVRVGLERMLGAEPDIDIVATAQDGGEAVDVVDRVECDVVLMDLSMPVKDGVQATREIVQKHGDAVNVVVLTSLSGRDDIMAALDAGASGYLLKDTEPHELLAAIRAAARGDAPLAPRAAREVLSARTEERAEPTLSTRETEVLRLVARGFPNKRIARELQISEKTVKAHLTQVFQRIGVTDRTQAALWAREHAVD